MKRLISKIFNPNDKYWNGATLALLLFLFLNSSILGYNFRTGIHPIIMSIIWVTITFVLFGICLILIEFLGNRVLKRIPTGLKVAIVTTAVSYFFFGNLRGLFSGSLFDFTGLTQLKMVSIGYIILNMLLLGVLWALFADKSTRKALYLVILAVVIADIYGIYWLSFEGNRTIEVRRQVTPNSTLNNLPDPSKPGEFDFNYFTYASNNEQRREEYKSPKYQTQTVDATRIIPDWKGKKAKWRKRFWGFGVKEFPINGRVWFPSGEGPFPLILIVHGNHSMEHYSDPGYTYLGELLASQGFITVSVDENFINGTWSGDFRGKEMPARAWILLKHLENWRKWNQEASHDLYGKIDLSNIILVGHSRGGEAVPIAAAFNKLSHFPDNALEEFDFNFGIKGLIAIAPTDKRYTRRIELQNVNYLSLQGSYDSDEASFFGLRQYQRIQFSDSSDYMKAGVYIHGANHGQFNSIWGRKDSGAPWNWLLNLSPIISGEDQRQIAKVYIPAFAKLIFNKEKAYSSIFQTRQSANEWLPEALILNNYEDSNYRSLISFGDDLNLSTWSNGTIEANNFKTWREEEVNYRDKDKQGINAVILGWDYGDEVIQDSVASYQMTLNQPVSPSNRIVMNLAAYKIDKKTPDVPLDFSITLTDSLGVHWTTKVSNHGEIAPTLEIQFIKWGKISDDIYGSRWEAAFQDIRISLDDASSKLQGIQKIELRFDQSTKGALAINKIGFEKD